MYLEDLAPMVLPEVIGCPQPTFTLHAAMAAHTFCVESAAWQEPVNMRTRQGQTSYDIELELLPLPTTQIVRVRNAWLDGQPLQPGTHYSAMQGQSRIQLHQAPRCGQTLALIAVLAPTLRASTLHDNYAQRWALVLASGTKASLLAIPGQTWSNPALAQHHHNAFQEGIAQARLHSTKGGVDTALTVRRRPFGNPLG